ncbi:MAG: hypothetical protein IKO55_02025 [Kiritimatiellae bacterium]|nr:hypothetical protein [Kiritimatiellia bacterium]
MTAEVAILRAYALASQRKYSKAKRMLGAVPEALRTTSGADLLARIIFEEGDAETARAIWKKILRFDPVNEAARKALSVPDAPRARIRTRLLRFCRKWKCARTPLRALAAAVRHFLGRFCRKGEKPLPHPVCQVMRAVIVEQKHVGDELKVVPVRGEGCRQSSPDASRAENE